MSALCQKQTSELFDIISGHCRIPHREPHVLLIAPTGATSALSNLRPRRAEDSNCSNYQQPEWNHPDARYRL